MYVWGLGDGVAYCFLCVLSFLFLLYWKEGVRWIWVTKVTNLICILVVYSFSTQNHG